MLITRTSMLSGITRTLDIPVTEEQMRNYEGGALLQRAFPNLPVADREFIYSGITDEEWQKEFPPEIEDEQDYIS